MKKLIIPTLLVWSSLTFAQDIAPLHPMHNYTPSAHSEADIEKFWDSMTTEVKDKDCYKRAHIWAYWLYRSFDVHSTKIFIHYTQRFNNELDEMGDADDKGGRLKDYDVDIRTRRAVKHNTTWDYHVAPMVQTQDGKKIVLERSLNLAYDVPTLEEVQKLSDMERYDEKTRKVLSPEDYLDNLRWNLEERYVSPEQWEEGLTVRGEILWDARKVLLEDDIKELNEDIAKEQAEIDEFNAEIAALNRQIALETKDSKKRRFQRRIEKRERRIAKRLEKITEIKSERDPLIQKHKDLGMADNDKIDIKCKKVDSIADVDKNHRTEWCYITEAPMYYWNEIDLRYLAYGNEAYKQSGWRYIGPIPPEYHTKAAYMDGRNYVQNDWNPEELDISAGEFKSFELRNHWKEIIDKDFPDED